MWLGAIVLDSKDSEKLADFYTRLLGWEQEVQYSEDDKWIVVMDKDHRYTPLVFQEDVNYERPVYPSNKCKQQQMLHLDFYVKHDEFEKEVEHALACGATLADVQYSDDWKVFIDPAGHPFCIIPIPSEMVKSWGV